MRKQYVKQEKGSTSSTSTSTEGPTSWDPQLSVAQLQAALLQFQAGMPLSPQSPPSAEEISALQSQLLVAQQQVSSLTAAVAKLERIIWDGRLSTIRNTLTGSGGTGA